MTTLNCATGGADEGSAGCVLSSLGDGVGSFLGALISPLTSILIVIAIAGFISALLYVFQSRYGR